MKGDANQIQTLKKVLHYIKKYRLYVAESLILAFAVVALTLYVPVLTGRAIDLALGKGQVDFQGIGRILLQIAVMAGLTALAQWCMNLSNNKITYGVIRDIREQAFRRIQVLPLKYIDGHAHGEIVSRVIADTDQFADGLLMGFTQLFTDRKSVV